MHGRAGAPITVSLAGLGEHRQSDLVAVECPGGACVGRQMNEKLDDLLLGHAGVQRYP